MTNLIPSDAVKACAEKYAEQARDIGLAADVRRTGRGTMLEVTVTRTGDRSHRLQILVTPNRSGQTRVGAHDHWQGQTHRVPFRRIEAAMRGMASTTPPAVVNGYGLPDEDVQENAAVLLEGVKPAVVERVLDNRLALIRYEETRYLLASFDALAPAHAQAVAR